MTFFALATIIYHLTVFAYCTITHLTRKEEDAINTEY
jgi:hypothetical protein